MSEIASDPREEAEIALEFELDAAPEKVWRAIALAAFRERWLPQADLAEPEPVASIPGVESGTECGRTALPFPTAPSPSGSSPDRGAARCFGSSIKWKRVGTAPTTIFAR
jgi:hypothetical protein